MKLKLLQESNKVILKANNFAVQLYIFITDKLVIMHSILIDSGFLWISTKYFSKNCCLKIDGYKFNECSNV